MEKKLQGKDLMNMGIYTAIYFFVTFLVAMLGFIPIFMVLMVIIAPLIGGIPFMLFLTKVKKPGMIFIMSVIMGLLMLLTGMGYWPLIISIIMALPKGYDTVIGESGGTLSGGERQRLSIARAMMKDAPIIILDEATANVDPENEKDLMTAIEELTREKTIIMIAHRLKTVRDADQILVMDQGRIVQNGDHDSLVEEDGIY